MTAKSDAVGAGEDANGRGQGEGANSLRDGHRGGKAGKRRGPSLGTMTDGIAEELERHAAVLLEAASDLRRIGQPSDPWIDRVWKTSNRLNGISSAAYCLEDRPPRIEDALRFWRPREPRETGRVLEEGRPRLGGLDSPLRWFGSKFRMIPNLLPLLPGHETWVDCFFGGGSVTFAKAPSPVEIVNDLDSNVVHFFRTLQDPEKARLVLRLSEMTPYSREWFDRVLDGLPPFDVPPADDVEEAYRFFVVNRMAFGGYCGGSGLSPDTQRPGWSYSISLDRREMSASVSVWLKGVASLSDVSRRLKRVQVDCLDFRVLIPRFDTPSTLFYLDPPYVPSTRVRGGYRHEMTEEDHCEMVDLLLGVRGMAVLSGYSHPVYDRLVAAGWERRDFESRIFCSGKGVKKSRRVESVWLNPAALRSGQLSLFWEGG